MNNDFNKAVLGICTVVILCCLFIAMKYEKEVSTKTIPLQLPVKENKMTQSFEEAVKITE